MCRFSTEEPWSCGDVELWRQKRLEYAGDVYGAWTLYEWNVYGICMEYAWNMHGICMEYA